MHDSRIWSECRLKDYCDQGRVNGIILGDSGYPCKSYLLTPLTQPQTPADARYQRAHAGTRVTIERCFGQWKSMFRALKDGLFISLPTVKTAIVAMAVLFNITKERDGNGKYQIVSFFSVKLFL